MGRRPGRERVLGPYPHTRGWQVRHIEPPSEPGGKGSTRYRYFPTEEDARRYKSLLDADIVRAATSLKEALSQYEQYLVDKGNKPRSYNETMRRLRRFFPSHGVALDLLTSRTCERYYRDLVATGMAPDSHRNYLAEAKSFLRWIVGRKWLPRNPLEAIQGVGKRRHGKPQLRIDEARRWLAKAEGLAPAEPGAVAALMTLLLGMRASEVVSRQVRDVDDDGRRLWIPDSKTEAGRRTLAVPERLRPHLAQLAAGRAGDAWLFPAVKRAKGATVIGHRNRTWVRDWVADICVAAKVPHAPAHGMRGLHASLAVEAGITPELVAASLGHESFATTRESYASQDSVDGARRGRALQVLDGGKTGVRRSRR